MGLLVGFPLSTGPTANCQGMTRPSLRAVPRAQHLRVNRYHLSYPACPASPLAFLAAIHAKSIQSWDVIGSSASVFLSMITLRVSPRNVTLLSVVTGRIERGICRPFHGATKSARTIPLGIDDRARRRHVDNATNAIGDPPTGALWPHVDQISL